MNNFIEMPEYIETDRHDMLIGPCSCGAWHATAEEVLSDLNLLEDEYA